MSASKTVADGKTASPLSAKDRAFWYAVWTLDIASYIILAVMIVFMAPRLGSGAVGAGLALGIGAAAYGMSRYGLWCLTRPYASTADVVPPSMSRALLCNFDIKLVFFALALIPSRELVFLSDYTIVYAVWAGLVLTAWLALMGPLEAANARDAARNLEAQGPQS